MSIQSNHHPETLMADDYATYAESFDPTTYAEEPDPREVMEGMAMRDLQAAVADLLASGWSMTKILTLARLPAGVPMVPLPPIPAAPSSPPPF